MWYGVDPLASDFPDWNPYNYTLNNPVRLIDPDGRGPTDFIYLWMKNSMIIAILKMILKNLIKE